MPELTIDEKFRFWSKVDILPDSNKCWEWQGSTDRSGYGKFHLSGENTPNRRQIASRVAFCDARGWPLEYLDGGCRVMHTCDNPKCCNFHHLELGTQRLNMRDMHRRGRHSRKLNPRKVKTIRSWVAKGRSRQCIAAHYGISLGTVGKIVTGKVWNK